MKKAFGIVIEKSTWKTSVFFTLLFITFYLLINFSGIGVSGLLDITGGASILDFEFGYTYEKADEMLSALGQEGRNFYLTKLLPLDFLFPLVYMLCFAGTTALLIKCLKQKERLAALLLVPVFAMVFDWSENIGIIAMLHNYKDLPMLAVSLSSISGILKTVFVIGSVITTGVLFLLFILMGIRKNRRA